MDKLPPLTPQQQRVLDLLRSGLNGQAVAREMGVHPASVSVWRRRIEAMGYDVPQPDRASGGRPRGFRVKHEPSVSLREPVDDCESVDWLTHGWAEFWQAEHDGRSPK